MFKSIMIILILFLPAPSIAQGNRIYKDADGGVLPWVPACLLIYDVPMRPWGSSCTGKLYPFDYDYCADNNHLMEAIAINPDGDATRGCTASKLFVRIDCNSWCIANSNKSSGRCVVKKSIPICREKQAAICLCEDARSEEHTSE